MKRLSKNQKIIAGIGIASGIGLLALFLKNRLGFGTGKPPLAGSQWRSAATSGKVRTTRASIQQLQNEHKRQVHESQIAAAHKEDRETAASRAEWSRRESIWEKNRALIEAAKP